MKPGISKKTLVVLLMLSIALCFVVGANWANGSIRRWYSSYFADIAIPFGYYFLLILVQDKVSVLKRWVAKAGAVFALCALSETLQYFGVYALASVFDLWDYAMYGAGVLLAAFVDRVVFTKAINSWE
jgi:Na+-transporting NADH:ubiquinone oxidoreductase subunit NqrD